jgi:hypothetical protein
MFTVKTLLASVIAILGLSGLGLLTYLSYADGSSGTVRVGFQVQAWQTLALASGLPGSGNSLTSVFTLPNPTPSDLAQGYIERERAVRLIARSNVPWAVRVHATENSMGQSFDGTYQLPVSALHVRTQDAHYLAVSTQDQVIARGQAGHYELNVDYKVMLDPSFKPGNYRVTLVYTISSN